jgi:hypothetical protein
MAPFKKYKWGLSFLVTGGCDDEKTYPLLIVSPSNENGRYEKYR